MKRLNISHSAIDIFMERYRLYSRMNQKQKKLFIVTLSSMFCLFVIFNFYNVTHIELSHQIITQKGFIGSGYMNRDIYDLPGQFSDGMIQVSIQLINLEAYFLDNFAGSIPNPTSETYVNNSGDKLNLNTKYLLDFSVKLSLSILILTTSIEAMFQILICELKGISQLIKMTFITCVLIIASPLIVKYCVDIFNSLNEVIIANYLQSNTNGKSLSQSLIYAMGVNANDPNPNYINFIGLSISLIINCFTLGINFFMLLFLSIVFPLILSVLPISGCKGVVLNFMGKYFSCLVVWPCWLICLSIVVTIINSSTNINSTTILGIIGIFSLAAIPHIITHTISMPQISLMKNIHSLINKTLSDRSESLKYSNRRVLLKDTLINES